MGELGYAVLPPALKKKNVDKSEPNCIPVAYLGLDMRTTVAMLLAPALRKVAEATATSDTAAADVWSALPTASSAARSPKTLSRRKAAVSELATSFLMRLEPAFHTELTQFGTT